jgi:hypothetical protein
LRRRDLAVIAAGQTWPENPGATGGSGTPAKDPYTWVRFDNRGLADVAVSIDGPVHNPLGVADPQKYWDRVRAGERRVRNTGLPAATEMHLLNLDPTNLAVVWVEYDTDAIVDLEGFIPVDMSIGAMAIKDISVFFTETTTPLAGSATFTGPWHDAVNYNWYGALALTDAAGGTLVNDEADASTPNVTNLVASQLVAATSALAPTPPAAGQQARIAPTKTVMRFVRTRFVNGATVQTRLNIQSSLSPVN